MALAVQIDMFEEMNDDTDVLRKEVKALAESQDKVRKTLFAKHSELMKLVIRQQEEIDRLKQVMRKRNE